MEATRLVMKAFCLISKVDDFPNFPVNRELHTCRLSPLNLFWWGDMNILYKSFSLILLTKGKTLHCVNK